MILWLKRIVAVLVYMLVYGVVFAVFGLIIFYGEKAAVALGLLKHPGTIPLTQMLTIFFFIGVGIAIMYLMGNADIIKSHRPTIFGHAIFEKKPAPAKTPSPVAPAAPAPSIPIPASAPVAPPAQKVPLGMDKDQETEYVRKLAAEKDLPALLDLLKQSGQHLPFLAAQALGQLGDPAGVDPLIDLLKTSWDEAIRGQVIDSLAMLADPRAIPALHIAALNDDSDNRIRAIVALAGLGEKKYRLFLTPGLAQKKGMSIRVRELDALLQQEQPVQPPQEGQAGHVVLDSQGASPLAAHLISPDDQIRAAAIAQVLKMGGRPALAEVEDAIRRLTGKPDLQFYDPAGVPGGFRQEIYDLLLVFARSGLFWDDPVLIQSMIPKIAHLNQQAMQELAKIDPLALALYQLLGIQMQLKIQAG